MKRKYLFAALVLLFTASCTTQRKAFNWMDKNPVAAAKYSISRFPIKTDTIRLAPKVIRTSDTLTLPGDTIPCPEPTARVPKPSVVCPPSKKIIQTDSIIQEVYIEKENPAKDRIITEQDNDIYYLQKDVQKFRERSKKYLYYLILSGLLLAGSVSLNIKRF